MDLGLRGRVAFVAASSRGLGRAIAEGFAAEGADVGMCARGSDDLDRAAEAVRAHGVRACPVPADVAFPEAATAAVERAVHDLGRLDCLVVNAGGPPPGVFAGLDDTAWRSAVDLVRAALPALRESDAASILFSSSWSIRQPIPGLLLSNSLRLAVQGLAKTLASELGPGVRVNSLLPGMIRTDRTLALAGIRAGDGRTVEDVIAEQSREIPLRRYGDPAEYARVAVFLSSPAAGYVTGATWLCDGGIVSAP